MPILIVSDSKRNQVGQHTSNFSHHLIFVLCDKHTKLLLSFRTYPNTDGESVQYILLVICNLSCPDIVCSSSNVKTVAISYSLGIGPSLRGNSRAFPVANRELEVESIAIIFRLQPLEKCLRWNCLPSCNTALLRFARQAWNLSRK